ncbi:hypothetical protein [Vulcanisaeta distributa]|uniref:hypothetical protein n=1 Tax=Vulcanisaeta distributa TaxID=164451 RepID=UPI0006CFEF8A|nr:hypothetical protein [Vulcanisaeta distributa]
MELKACWGGIRKGKRLRCSEEIRDRDVLSEAERLINEFLNRIKEHRNILFSGLTTPFDPYINDLTNLFSNINAKLDEFKNIVLNENNKKELEFLMTIRYIIKVLLKLVKEAKEWWLRIGRSELEKLVDGIINGKITVIIRGELKKDKDFMVHLYTEHLAVIINRIAKSGSVVMHITFTGLKDAYVVVPRLFDDDKLRAMQNGWLMTDGTIHKGGYPEMGTNYLWQVIAWLMVFPGKNHVDVSGISINNGVRVIWLLTALDLKFEGRDVNAIKYGIAEDVAKYSNELFKVFLLPALLADGNFNIRKKIVKLAIGVVKYELWKPIIKNLMNMNFSEHDHEYIKEFRINSSKAVTLVRDMLSDSFIRVMIEVLSMFNDAKKLRQLIELANARTKALGSSMIEINGIKLTININDKGNMELRAYVRIKQRLMKLQKDLRLLTLMLKYLSEVKDTQYTFL